MTRCRTAFAVTLIATLLVTVPSALSPRPALAGPDEVAREHYQRGQELVQEKRYREALEAFETGYRLSRRPAFLFNMAECARKLGEEQVAVTLYKRYLQAAPTGNLSALARERINEIEAQQPTERQPPTEEAPTARDHRTPPDLRVHDDPSPDAENTNLVHDRRDTGRSGGRPLWKRWGFWAGVGVVVAAGTVTAFVLTRDGSGCSGAGCIDVRN